MIVSRSPCRISFAGGGSDLASFYAQHGGAVVSTAIDKYVYVMVNAKFDNRIRVSYSITEEAEQVDDIKHPIVREALQLINLRSGVEIVSIADIPSRGTGLGSSSTFTVGLLNSLLAFRGQYASQEMLGRMSAHLEIERCNQPIGKQDHYAAAYGGFNLINFHKDGTVGVRPIICQRSTLGALEKNLIMFYTGITRSASEILAKQSAAMTENVDAVAAMQEMVRLAHQLAAELENDNLDAFGPILHENWILKTKMAAGVSSSAIDGWYQKAMAAGAEGGKILGAGGGGFLLFYASHERHEAIERALSELRRIPFSFDWEGSRIVFYNPTVSSDLMSGLSGDAVGGISS